MYINVGFLIFHIISWYKFLGQYFINYIFMSLLGQYFGIYFLNTFMPIYSCVKYSY